MYRSFVCSFPCKCSACKLTTSLQQDTSMTFSEASLPTLYVLEPMERAKAANHWTFGKLRHRSKMMAKCFITHRLYRVYLKTNDRTCLLRAVIFFSWLFNAISAYSYFFSLEFWPEFPIFFNFTLLAFLLVTISTLISSNWSHLNSKQSRHNTRSRGCDELNSEFCRFVDIFVFIYSAS